MMPGCFRKRESSKKKSLWRRVCPIVVIFFIFLSCFYGRFDITQGFVPNVAYADSGQMQDLEQELEDEVQNQISNLDFSDVEAVIEKLSTSAKKLFDSGSFGAKLESVISGEYAENSTSFFSAVMSIFVEGFKSFLPIIASIISIAILGGRVSNLKPATNGKSIGNIVHFVTYGVVIIFLGATLVQLIGVTTSTLTNVKSMFDAIFPILLTLLTAVGGSVSVGIYQPAIALLSNVFILKQCPPRQICCFSSICFQVDNRAVFHHFSGLCFHSGRDGRGGGWAFHSHGKICHQKLCPDCGRICV